MSRCSYARRMAGIRFLGWGDNWIAMSSGQSLTVFGLEKLGERD